MLEKRSYELTGSDYAYWYDVNAELGGAISAEIQTQLHKEPGTRTFDAPLLRTFMPYLQQIADRRCYILA